MKVFWFEKLQKGTKDKTRTTEEYDMVYHVTPKNIGKI